MGTLHAGHDVLICRRHFGGGGRIGSAAKKTPLKDRKDLIP
jgi:hypothetical protein